MPKETDSYRDVGVVRVSPGSVLKRHQDPKFTPVIRKTKKKPKKPPLWSPGQHVPGVEHKVEGMDTVQDIANFSFFKKIRKQRKRQAEGYRMKQAARQRIAEIPDPEAGQAERRRKAARRRMRGRLGTILSDRETLG